MKRAHLFWIILSLIRLNLIDFGVGIGMQNYFPSSILSSGCIMRSRGLIVLVVISSSYHLTNSPHPWGVRPIGSVVFRSLFLVLGLVSSSHSFTAFSRSTRIRVPCGGTMAAGSIHLVALDRSSQTTTKSVARYPNQPLRQLDAMNGIQCLRSGWGPQRRQFADSKLALGRG